MSNDDNIQFAGPSLDHKPPIGSGFDTRFSGYDTASIYDYADIDHLRKVLGILSTEIDEFLKKLETDLSKFNLKVEEDTKLKEAHKVEWPAELGDPKGYVSFVNYKALENANSRSAIYIRKTYEEHMRGPSGSMALDISLILKAIKSEITNIEEFLDENVGDVSDTAEKRILELLQNWAEKAVFHERKIRIIYEKGEPQNKLSSSEVDLLSTEDARKYQALFKVKINFINNQVAQIVEDLKKSVGGELSQAYFTRFLGPALKMRLKAIRTLDTFQVSTTAYLPKEADLGATNLNANLAVTISDQIKRNDLFNSNMDQIAINIVGRDTYTGYISQLQEKGSALQEKFTDETVTDDEYLVFTQMAEAEPATDYNFTSAHASLAGVEDDAAHPQYLLRSGGTISGDVALDSGSQIDGIVPSTHSHTGADGSARISGTSIIGGTIDPTHVDPTNQPGVPTELTVVSLTAHTTATGGTTVDALLSWIGDDNCTFEFGVAKVV